MNPFANITTWHDMQTLSLWQWLQQEHDDIGGAIEAAALYPASPPMNVGTVE